MDSENETLPTDYPQKPLVAGRVYIRANVRFTPVGQMACLQQELATTLGRLGADCNTDSLVIGLTYTVEVGYDHEVTEQTIGNCAVEILKGQIADLSKTDNRVGECISSKIEDVDLDERCE